MKNSIAFIKNIHPYLEKRVRLFFYRRKAHRLIKRLVHKKGYKVVDRQTKKYIKSYAKEIFGSAAFWPWLALYTEIRGEFKKGWLPNDYYMAHLLKQYNPESIRISAYKTFDYKMFPEFALKPLLIKVGNVFYDSDRKQITTDEAQNILYDYDGEVVLKEDLGFGGHNVKFIKSKELKFNNYAQISSYIIQPVVEQHHNLYRLNDKALNTMRVLTYLNGEGTVDIKYSYLRFGVGDSRVDNTSSGGGFCFIKSDNHLAKIARDKFGFEIGERHPDTGILFQSVAVPSYEKVLQECIKSHKIFPYFKFIGWDVAIDKSGDPVLLEWNSEPLIWMAEALQGPFFKKELIKKDLLI